MKNNTLIRKIVINLIKVCIAAFLFVSLNLLFMPKYIGENEDGRIMPEYYREKTPIDVVFTGSSLVQAGISPMSMYRDFGITAYDRSNSSQTIALSYYVIEDTIKRNKPELIVADVGFMYESEDYVEEPSTRKSLDGMKWSSTKSNCIKAMMGKEEHFIDYVFPILRFHSRWNDLDINDLKYMYYKPTVTKNGQLMHFEVNEDYVEPIPYKIEEDTLICEYNLYFLQKICDICNANNVQLYLIKMPSIQGNWCRTFDSQIEEIANRNNVIYKSYIDDFEQFNFDIYNDFYDTQHMNCSGAEKFSKVLATDINNNFNITDRRNDIKIKNIFDSKLEKYNAEIANNM